MAYVIPKDPQVMTRKGALFIVADGMGGHAAGEVASEIAVDTVSYAYYQEDNDDAAVSLMRAIKRANTLIHQRAAENMLRSGMGTTCVAGVLRGSTAYIANVGDSRTYIVRNGQVRQVSQDHSWVAEQVRAGLLTEDQARSHAQRNVITRCLGTQSDVEVDIFAEPLQEGDSFILCSDGLSGFVSDDDLLAIVNQYVPQESVYHLVERANENGGPDNITAIVVRVQEVGWEPVGTRVNGHDITRQITLTDGQMVGPVALMQGENGRGLSAPAPIPTGPLHPSESVTSPQASLHVPRRKRGRLLYPTLILFILLTVMLVSGGIYYSMHMNSSANFDSSFKKAEALVQQGQNDVVNKHPAQALQHLSTAQSILLSLQDTSLTDAQKTQVKSLLDGNLTTTAKGAIVNYNMLSLITPLTCASKMTTLINNGSTNALASGIATVHNGNGTKTFFYALGGSDNNANNNNIYQLSDQPNGSKSLQNPYLPENNTNILSIASDGSHLLALTGSSTKGATPVAYRVLLLTPDDTGALKASNSQITIDAAFTKDGNTPGLLTVSGADIYVVLTSDTSPMTATILYYTIDSKNDKLGTPTSKNSQTISTSNSLTSIAAFPHQQLFLLTKDGNVQSLTFTGGSQAPTPVAVQPGLASPLALDVNNFSSSVPIVPPTPTLEQSTVLQVPNAKFLVASTVGSDTHLYVVDDSMYHRVIDLAMMNSSPPTSTVTTSTGTSMKMRLVQQYVSTILFTNVKGIEADSKAMNVYLIVQNEQNSPAHNLVTVNTSSNSACAS